MYVDDIFEEADAIIEEFISTHPDRNPDIVRRAVREAVQGYDTEKCTVPFKTYALMRIRTELLKAGKKSYVEKSTKQEEATTTIRDETNEDKSSKEDTPTVKPLQQDKTTNTISKKGAKTMTPELKQKIIDDVNNNGLTPVEVADKYGLNKSTAASNINNWRAAGLITASDTEKDSTAAEAPKKRAAPKPKVPKVLSFTEACTNAPAFLSNLLKDGELCSCAADNEKGFFRAVYKLSNGKHATISVAIEDIPTIQI